jgi:hypothetical protein
MSPSESGIAEEASDGFQKPSLLGSCRAKHATGRRVVAPCAVLQGGFQGSWVQRILVHGMPVEDSARSGSQGVWCAARGWLVQCDFQHGNGDAAPEVGLGQAPPCHGPLLPWNFQKDHPSSAKSRSVSLLLCSGPQNFRY